MSVLIVIEGLRSCYLQEITVVGWFVEKKCARCLRRQIFITYKKIAQRKLNAREAYESLVNRRAVGLDCSALTLLLQEESGS
jgi:hypothetical protein